MACAIVAVEFAIICRSQVQARCSPACSRLSSSRLTLRLMLVMLQSTVNCTSVAATTFNLTVSAEINSTQVMGASVYPTASVSTCCFPSSQLQSSHPYTRR